jgi:hypothetical protein
MRAEEPARRTYVPWREAIVLAAGVAIAWMDTRPHWDDTGVTAGALLVLAAAGAIAGVKPWWSALLAILPLLAAEARGNAAILFAVVIPVAGAFAGAWVRRAFRSRRVDGRLAQGTDGRRGSPGGFHLAAGPLLCQPPAGWT